MKSTFAAVNMKIYMIVLSIIMLLSQAGCTGGGTLEMEEKEVTVKILVGALGENSANLDLKYGNAFRKLYPNVKLEYVFVNTMNPSLHEGSVLSEEMAKSQPDLIISNPSDYKEIAQAGLLHEISGSDAVNLYPPVIDYMKTLGKSPGPLYGVTDEFFIAAIEYNKKLFDRYQVEYPSDGMTWEDIFNIASKFPHLGENNSKLYGLYFPWSSENWLQGSLIDAMKRSAGLTYTEGTKFNLHTDEWKQVLSLAVNGYIQGYLSPTKDMDPAVFYEDLFGQEQAAMTYRYLPRGKSGQFMQDAAGIGYVREPVGPSFSASSFSMNRIFSINKQAAQPIEAMELIRFINSDDIVRSNLERITEFPQERI